MWRQRVLLWFHQMDSPGLAHETFVLVAIKVRLVEWCISLDDNVFLIDSLLYAAVYMAEKMMGGGYVSATFEPCSN